MKHNFSYLSVGGIIFILLFTLSCTRINEATELGSDLIPAVDNVNTFEEILDVEAYNEVFTSVNDSSRSIVTDEQFLGYISNDPLFGKTKASMFFELKPILPKFSFPVSKDSLFIDSVVLVLRYLETYGDSLIPQSVNVFELAQTNVFKPDSSYYIQPDAIPFQLASQIGPTKTFFPNLLDDSVILFREKSKNQLRIPLNPSFGQRLLNYDSFTTYSNDSAFKKAFAGFAVVPNNTGNAILGFSLRDTNTKLAVYYKFKNRIGNDSTAVTYFRPTNSSASANEVERNYSGSALAGFLGGTAPDNLIFLQNTPGTFAKIKIPALSILSNRVVHRAELIVQQVFDPLDLLFTPPSALFIDAFDSSKPNYRTIPYDLTFDINGNINSGVFGIFPKRTTDAFGNTISVWKLNLTRYVQHVVNKTEPNYELRLSSPFLLKDIFKNGTLDQTRLFSINPSYAKGRVRVGGTNHPTQAMKLRIIYSKL